MSKFYEIGKDCVNVLIRDPVTIRNEEIWAVRSQELGLAVEDCVGIPDLNGDGCFRYLMPTPHVSLVDLDLAATAKVLLRLWTSHEIR